MPDPSHNGHRRSGWSAGWRRAVGANVCASLLLAGALAVLVNYISQRHYARWHIGRSTYFVLSPKTLNLLADMTGRVRITVLFEEDRPGVPLLRDIRELLKEYDAAAARASGLKLAVEYVDPGVDLGRTKEIKQRYELTEGNVVVVACGNRFRVIGEKDIFAYDPTPTLYGRQKRKTAFRGEQMISSAILAVTETAQPVVYFLDGHGERSPADFGEERGYSRIARLMRADNMDLRTLTLVEGQPVPAACNALVIAGPRKSLRRSEVDAVRQYLAGGGRLFALLDSGAATGLDELLQEWGVRIEQDRVIDLSVSVHVADGQLVAQSQAGGELHVRDYGRHPITERLRDIDTVFYAARSVEPVAAAGTDDATADRPRVTVLASTSPHAWAETDLRTDPPRYDAGADRRGRIGVAVAAEKGGVRAVDVGIGPTRLVVVGDSEFAANGCLAGGNGDFFLNSMNWLLSRSPLMAISAKAPFELRVKATERQMRLAYALVVGGLPALTALAGAFVWMARRDRTGAGH